MARVCKGFYYDLLKLLKLLRAEILAEKMLTCLLFILWLFWDVFTLSTKVKVFVSVLK